MLSSGECTGLLEGGRGKRVGAFVFPDRLNGQVKMLFSMAYSMLSADFLGKPHPK